MAWNAVLEMICKRARRTVASFLASGAPLTDRDVFTIAMGHALELLSQYWPNVADGSRTITISEALVEVGKMADGLLPLDGLEQADATTRFYVTTLVRRGSLSWKRFCDAARAAGVDPADLEAREIVERRGSSVYRNDAEARRTYLRSLATSGALSLYLDWAQFLRNEHVDARSIEPWLTQLPDRSRLAVVCRLLFQRTADKGYWHLAQALDSEPADTITKRAGQPVQLNLLLEHSELGV